MTVVGLILNDMGCCRSGDCIFRVTAVEIPMAAAGGAFERGWICGSSGRGGHELAAAVQSMAAHTGSVILEAFFVDQRRRRGRRVVVALEDTIGEGVRFGGWLEFDGCFRVKFRGFHSSSSTGGNGGSGGGNCRNQIHSSNI